MADQTPTSAAAVIQEVVSSIVQETLQNNSVLIPTVADFSSQAVNGLDTIKISRFTDLSVDDVVDNTEDTPEASTIATDDLLMDSHKIISWRIPDRTDVQSAVNINQKLIEDSAVALAAKVDEDIATQLRLASAAAPDHRIVFGTITEADILEGKRLLDVQNVPMVDRWLAIGPAQLKDMLQIANFIQADRMPTDALTTGMIGQVFGFKVVMTTASTLLSDEFLMYHKDACAYATQIAPRFESERRALRVATDYALTQLYGTLVLDGGVRNVLFNDDGA